jgi:hypothetical protein
MKAFILDVNKMKQEDADKAIDTYCKKLEEVIYNAIRSLTITIPSSAIQVAGSSTNQTNVNKIVLKNVVS